MTYIPIDSTHRIKKKFDNNTYRRHYWYYPQYLFVINLWLFKIPIWIPYWTDDAIGVELFSVEQQARDFLKIMENLPNHECEFYVVNGLFKKFYKCHYCKKDISLEDFYNRYK